MQYNQTIQLRDGRACVLRHALAEDAAAVIDNFDLTHGETDYLLTYPDESRSDVAAEARFLQAKADSANEVEIIAQVGDVIAGTAGIDAVGGRYKLRHRAEFGVSVAREYWGLGIGRALMNACIDCARQAGYTQLELDVVADNARAMALYTRQALRSMAAIQEASNPARRGIRNWCICGWRCKTLETALMHSEKFYN